MSIELSQLPANPFIPQAPTVTDAAMMLTGASAPNSTVHPLSPDLDITPREALLRMTTQRIYLPGGHAVTPEQLSQSDAGAKLLAVMRDTSEYDFFSGISDGSWLDFVPFANLFASVGGSRDDARIASEAYKKLSDGQPISLDEAIKVQLHLSEEQRRSQGTWGSTVGRILRGAPAFYTEMGIIGKVASGIRTGIVSSKAAKYSDEAVEFLSRAGVTRAVANGSDELGSMFVKSAIDADISAGVYSTVSDAAKAYLKSPEFIKATSSKVAEGVSGLMLKSAPHVTKVGTWAPGLQAKVAETVATRSVNAALARFSNDSRWARYFGSAGEALKKSMFEGLFDVGAWGTESATTVMTRIPNAARAYGQAALDFTVGGLTRGAALWLPREAVSQGMGELAEALGHEEPVRANTLNLQMEAWAHGDQTLMSRAENVGMWLDLLEYVSESTGRGFNSLARGVGLTFAPKLMAPAAKTAGTLHTRGTTQVIRDAAGKAITDVKFDAGIVDAAMSAEVGGVMQRYLNKIALGRNIKENVAQDGLLAVKHRLTDKLKVDLTGVSDAALLATVQARKLDPSLPTHVAQAIGTDVNGFLKTAIKEANREGLRNMKIHGFMTYFIADYAARHNLDAKRAWEAFRTMGYDGVLAEMSEERYNDVMKTLFELEADRKEGWEKLTTAVRRAFWPDGGWKQLTAEAVGFAVPMGVRAVVTRSLAALGTPNEYAELNAWAAGSMAALRHGSVQHFKSGDYIEKINAQVARLRAAAKTAGEGGPSAADYETAALRAEQLRDEFLKSIDPNAKEFAAPIYSDNDLLQPEAEYGRMPHITPEQATEALAGYKNLTAFAAKAGQIQYKLLHRAKDEPRNWFMRAGHKLTEFALRLGGTLATGEFAFLTANPASFATVEHGMNPAFLNALEKAYGNVYKSVVEKYARVDEGVRTVDTDAAHEEALQQFQHQAQGLMAQHLAAMHVYMFSKEELRDISLQATAQEDGYLVDPVAKQFVKPDGTRISFEDYEKQPGVAERINARVVKDSQVVYDLIANASDPEAASLSIRTTETEAMIRRLVNIPKGMPNGDRAVLATILRYHPAFADTGYADFRNVMTSVNLDPEKSIATQLPGIATRHSHLRELAKQLQDGKTFGDKQSFDDAVARIKDVDPGLVELIARDLGYTHNFTEKSKQARDAAVARYALMTAMLDDPDVAMFHRGPHLSEEGQRIGAQFSEIAPARRTAEGWTAEFIRVEDGARVSVTRATLEELEEVAESDEFGYSRRARNIIHTPVRTLYADTAQDFISTLNLGREYRIRMDAAQGIVNDTSLLDPLVRTNKDGSFKYTIEDGLAQRKREADDAAQYIAHGKSANIADYTLPGQNKTSPKVLAEAKTRMETYYQAWLAREQRTEDGKPLGYNAIAEDLVNEFGVRGGLNSKLDNEFGVVSPMLRNRFAMDIRMLTDRTGDIYIPIDHAAAQSYGASLLDAALFEAYARNRRFIREVFPSYFRDFLIKVEELVDQKTKEAKDDAAKRRWTEFSNKYVKGSRTGGRLISPETFDTFVSAFCLYRTEVPNAELMSTLGDYAPELKELAVVVRDMKEFIPFSAAVDVILGGAGFDFTVGNKWDTGLSKYFAVFSPLSAKTFAERVTGVDASTRDAAARAEASKKMEAFAAEARRAVRHAIRTAARIKEREDVRSTDDEFSEATPVNVTPKIDIPQDVSEIPAVTPEFLQQIQVVRDVAAAEIQASGATDVDLDTVTRVTAAAIGAGETAPTIPESVTEEEGDGISIELPEGIATGENENPLFGPGVPAVAENPAEPYDTTESGERKTSDEVDDETTDLSKDEARAFAASLAEVVKSLGAETVTRESLTTVVNDVLSSMPLRERTQVIDAFTDTVVDAETDEWVWDTGSDEDGVNPSEFENNNSRNVDILRKSPAIRRLLSIISKTSTATGREFQPCVEDLRAFVEHAPFFLRWNLQAEAEAGTHDLQDAIEFLKRLLNPRALDYATTNIRAAIFDVELSKFGDYLIKDGKYSRGDGPGRLEIRRYIKALTTPLAPGKPVPSATAAMFLSYLLSLKQDNVRSSLAQMIASSASAGLVDLKTTVSNNEQGVSYMLNPVDMPPGKQSLEAITSQFMRWVGRSPSVLKEAIDELRTKFTSALDYLHWEPSAKTYPEFFTSDRMGLLDVYARILTSVFGSDAPIAVACTSNRLRLALMNGDVRDQLNLCKQLTTASTDKLPRAVTELLSTLENVLAHTEGDVVTADVVEAAAIGLFRSGASTQRHINWAEGSLQGTGVWAKLLRAYSDVKPVTIVRADLDPERSHKPASSIAVTMAGIEPALQLFLDREDSRGFVSVCARLFPETAQQREKLLRSRGGVRWPNRYRTEIVVKNRARSAFDSEVAEGAANAFYAALDTRRKNGKFSGKEVVFVPLFSGDHASSIIIQIPLNDQLIEMAVESSRLATIDQVAYDDIATMVADWLGLDYFGVDAKRSAITSLEAPNVPMFGVKTDENGQPVLDANGKPETGHVTYGLVWNTNPGANNEAMLGTLQMYGFGASRLRRMALDPNSATLKCHISATSPDMAFGAFPTLTKALAIGYGRGDADNTGRFLENTAERIYQDLMESSITDDLSTYILCDADSIKLDVLNSKVVGVQTQKGIMPLMKYIFEVRVPALLKEKHDLSDVSGDELSTLIGDIPWVDYTKSSEPTSMKLTQLVPKPRLRQVPGAPEGIFVFERQADHLTAFQVANVSHKALAGYSLTPRNYMLDALAVTKTLETHNATTHSKVLKDVMVGLPQVRNNLRNLITSWGMFGAVVTQDQKSLDNMMELDEEWQEMLARGEVPTGMKADEVRRKLYAAWYRKDFRTLPLYAIQAPLVANIAWVDKNTGDPRLHVPNAMFMDTQFGPRTIDPKLHRFYRAAKRHALCNVNCSEPNFRYGMFIDDVALLKHKTLAEYGLIVTSGKSDEENVVLTLEKTIEYIAKFEHPGESTQKAERDDARVRIALADCLYDHEGTKFSHRRSIVYTRDEKTGELTTNMYRTALDVSYYDLFTGLLSEDGSLQFDRAAIHTNMHNAKGETCMYLAGTLFGLPRTPSLNGSMWDQAVRAALPATTASFDADVVVDSKQKKTKTIKQWRSGYDAMVSPDPYTLKILGCDHDGDKTAMYMFDVGVKGRFRDERGRTARFTTKELMDFVSVIDGILAASGLEGQADVMDSARQRWIREGLIEYETVHVKNPDGSTTRKQGGLKLTKLARARLNNTFVGLLFDTNRALPVPSKGNVSVYTGTVVDDNHRGNMANGTKAAVASDLRDPTKPDALNETTTDPKAAWDVVKKEPGVLTPEVMNVSEGRTLRKLRVSSLIGTNAKQVSESRALAVAANGYQHISYALSLGPLARVLGIDFVDHMYHEDGLGNMTFDDMKEQICSRLGIKPWMIDTLVADTTFPGGELSLTVTDRLAVERIAAFSRNQQDVNHLYYYLARGGDPANFKFKKWARTLSRASFSSNDGTLKGSGDKAHEASLTEFANLAAAEQVDPQILSSLSRRSEWPAIRSFLYYSNLPASDKLSMILAWMRSMEQIEHMKTLAKYVNYTKADPGDAQALTAARKLLVILQDHEGKNAVAAAIGSSKEATRMAWATYWALLGQGKTPAAVTHDAVDSFRRYGKPYKGTSVYGRAAAVAALAAPMLDPKKDALILANNARMIPMAAMAFAHPRVVEGSMFNIDAYEKCAALAECIARARHTSPDGNVNMANLTLDFRFAVESMLDIVCRTLASSNLARNQIFNYLAEYPDSGANQFSPKKLGPAARGLSRATLGLADISQKQLDMVREYWTQIVELRELDADHPHLTQQPLSQTMTGKPYPFTNLDLTLENLEAMRTWQSSQSGAFMGEKSSNVRSVHDDLTVLIEAFTLLERDYKKLFPNGVRIAPSALFGQLLSMYAAITDYIDNVPGPGSRSLMAIIPDEYTRLSQLAADATHGSFALRSLLDLNTAIDWSPSLAAFVEDVPVSRYKISNAARRTSLKDLEKLSIKGPKGKKLPPFEADDYASMFSDKGFLNDDAATRDRLKALYKAFATQPYHVRGRNTICVFDGLKGLAFRDLLRYIRFGGLDETHTDYQIATMNETVAASAREEELKDLREAYELAHPFEAPKASPDPVPSALPSRRPARPVIAETTSDVPEDISVEKTRAVATRLQGIFENWGDYEIKLVEGTTNEFYILGNMHATNELAEQQLFKTRINVKLVNSPALTDADIDRLLQDPQYVESVLAKAKVTQAKFKLMSPARQRALVKRYRPVGRTIVTKPSEGFSFSMGQLEQLTATVYLDAKGITDTGSDYHEAFHAVMGFVRHIGVLSKSDIKVLQDKYGHRVIDGVEWFNEEPAAYDFQRVTSHNLSPELLEKPEAKSVLQKIAQFFAALFNALKHAIASPGYWTSESYARDMETNPLMHIMLTGQVRTMDNATSDETVTVTDRRGLLVDALQKMNNYMSKYYIARKRDPKGAMKTYHLRPGPETWDAIEKLRRRVRIENPGLTTTEVDSIWVSRLTESDWVNYAEAFDEILGLYGKATGVSEMPAADAITVKGRNKNVDEPSFDEVFDAAVGISGIVIPSGIATDTHNYMVDYVVPYFRDKTRNLKRLAVPYSEHEQLARSLAIIIREANQEADKRSDDYAASVDFIARRTPQNSYKKQTKDRELLSKLRGAVSRMADVFGVDPEKFTREQEKLLFRGLCQLNTNLENVHVPVYADQVNLKRKAGKPETAPTSRKVTAAVLAANMSVPAGLSPADIVESAIVDLQTIMSKRPAGDGMSENVINQHLLPFLNNLALEADDPTMLLERFTGDVDFNATFAAIMSGLTSEKDADGYHYKFNLATAESDNPYYEGNVSRYANYVNDPDFQEAIARTADVLFLLAASRNLYNDLGFTPGKASDLSVIGQRRESKTPMEMAMDLNAHPAQYVEDGFASTSFYDQPWFMAASPKMWLDSMLAPSFGKVDLRAMAQGMHRDTEGFKNRIVSLRNLHAFEYGLADLAGTELIAVDEEYDSDLGWEAGRIVRHERDTVEAKRRAGGAIRRYLNYKGKRTKGISLTLNEQRLVDLVLKARRVFMSGGRKMITGVDGLTISAHDSHDPAYYTREKVAQRVAAGRAGRDGVGHMSDIDRILRRLDRQLHDDQHGDHFEFITEGGANNYNFREEFVNAICNSIKRHLSYPSRTRSINDLVLEDLSRQGFVNNVTNTTTDKFGNRITRNISGTLSLDVDRIEDLFLKSSAYKKLLDAGRKPEWLTRDAYIKPYRDLWIEVRNFVKKHPFLSEGDGRFFHTVNSPLPFVRGSGVFMHNAITVEDRTHQEKIEEVLPKFMEAFPGLAKETPIKRMDDNLFALLRTLHLVDEITFDDFLYQLGQGKYAEKPGVNLDANSTARDAAEAIYRTLTEMVWTGATEGEFKELGGRNAVIDALEAYRERRFDEMTSVVSGGSAGMSDELVHSLTGVLPASHELGHAMQNAIDGIMTALAYRATLVNMITTPSEDGTPVCYVKPALHAAHTAGVPDELWGTVGRWYAGIHQLPYDETKTGIENVRSLYDTITGSPSFNKSKFGSINPEEMDTRAIEGFMARKGTPDGESTLANMAGGYALGYAKHLFQSTKGLGGKWQRAIIHRALGYSKSLSVSFSLFFPIATRFESPVGAVGALATVMGNISTGAMESMAKTVEDINKALSGKSFLPQWITKDFVGNNDFVKLLESNDPFMADMYMFASAIGLGMSTTNKNAFEHSRGVMLEDLRNLTEYVNREFGLKAARQVKKITSTLFERSSERAFAYHMNATKLAVAAQMCMKLRYEAEKRGQAFDPVRDLRRYSQYINAEVGGIDPLSSAWNHPKMRALMNILFFSFDWTLGAWVAAGGPILTRLFTGGHTITPEETKYMFGRALRMGGWVAFGLPMIAQVLIKALAMGIDPDDEDREDEPWWIWQNEAKARNKAFDLTPLLRAIGKRFPKYEEFRRNHSVLAALPVMAFPLLRNPLYKTAAFTASIPATPADVEQHEHTYMHFGKQWWEIGGWFEDPVKSFFGKTSMPLQKLSEGVLGRSLTSMGHELPWNEMGAIERWVSPTTDSALFNMVTAFLPFSVNGLGKASTQGILPILGPVGTGASKYAIIKDLEDAFTDWAENDRGSYSFNGKRPENMKAFTKYAMRNNDKVRSLIYTAMANGRTTEADAFRLVNIALQKYTSKLYKELIEEIPESPNDKIDVKSVKRILRKLQRCGKFGLSLREGLIKRLKEQDRWQRLSADQKRELDMILRDSKHHPHYTGAEQFDY